MNYSNSNSNGSVEPQNGSAILKSQNLEMEFNVLMKQYEQAKLNYANDLQTTSDVLELQKDRQMMDILNQKLMDLSTQIQSQISNGNAETQQEVEQNAQQAQNLKNSYAILTAERTKINGMLNDYGTLDRKYEDTMIQTESNNGQYMLWAALAIVIVAYLLKVLLFPGIDFNVFRIFFWLLLLILSVISSFHLNKGSGFLMWITIVCVFAIISAKFIPSP